MRDLVLATAVMMRRCPSDQPSQTAIAADNDNNVATIGPHATPANRNWRSTRAGSIAQRLAPVLVIVGVTLTVAWSAMLYWVIFRIFVF
jgi:hypothetical protein